MADVIYGKKMTGFLSVTRNRAGTPVVTLLCDAGDTVTGSNDVRAGEEGRRATRTPRGRTPGPKAPRRAARAAEVSLVSQGRRAEDRPVSKSQGRPHTAKSPRETDSPAGGATAARRPGRLRSRSDRSVRGPAAGSTRGYGVRLSAGRAGRRSWARGSALLLGEGASLPNWP